MVLLGSEVIVISVEDARKLTKAFLKPGRDDKKELQRLGVLGILNALFDAVRSYDYDDCVAP